MTFRVTALMAFVTATLWGSSAFAQTAGEDQPTKFRKWDFSSTLGIVGTSQRDFGSRSCGCGGSDPALTWSVDGGRFLTTHLKVDTGLMLMRSRTYYEYVETAPGQYSSFNRHVRPTSF